MAKSIMSSVSFKEYYFEQLVFLEMQHSKSNFICELIKKHMEENGIRIAQEEIDKCVEAKKNKQKYSVKVDIDSSKRASETNIQQAPQPEITDTSTQDTDTPRRNISWLTKNNQ